MRQFTPEELQTLHQLIIDLFDDETFDILLITQFGPRYRLRNYAGNISFPAQVLKLLVTASQEGWHLRLLERLSQARGSVQAFSDIAADLKTSAPSAPHQPAPVRQIGPQFESIVTNSGFYDARLWAEKITEFCYQVCAIKIDREIYGTGFLVGPDLVLTNYHVAAHFIDPTMHKRVSVVFDYWSKPNGLPSEGTAYTLAQNGAIVQASEPYPPLDKSNIELEKRDYPKDKLDFALLRLSARAGDEVRKGGTRGYVKYPHRQPDFIANAPIIIFQHPLGNPLKIALENFAYLGADPKGVRIRYKTDTEEVASGSPVFNHKMQWIALHHIGAKGQYNQGIPSLKIIESLSPDIRKELSEEA